MDLGLTVVSGGADITGNSSVIGNLDVSGNVTTNTFSTPGGFSVDASGGVISNSLSSKTITTPSGFSVDVSGNVNVSNTSTFVGTSLFNQSVMLDQSLYVADGAYVNKEYTNVFTVGDSSNGNGVTMYSSGTTLNVRGITQDLSSNVFPINVAVKGSLSLIDSSSTNSITMSTVYDSSGDSALGLIYYPDTSGSIITGSAGGIAYNISLVINGVTYYINLYSSRS